MDRAGKNAGMGAAYGAAVAAIVLVLLILAHFTPALLATHATAQNKTVKLAAGQRISNFQIQHIVGNSITGLLYMEYPIGSANGVETVLYVGETVGYACDGSLARLVGIADGSATFATNMTSRSKYGCPICLSGNTAISTPEGLVNVKDLGAGMEVWTADGNGNMYEAVVLETSRVRVPAAHLMVHLVLADGRELFASQGHPTADGRALGTLRPGDSLDGSSVVSTQLVGYGENYTYDILPSGPTGYYWADGILVGSTLAGGR